jgi:hypothetical protein
MPRDLASMMRFSIWSLIPSPWRPPISLALITRSTCESNVSSLIASGQPSLKRIEISSSAISTPRL